MKRFFLVYLFLCCMISLSGFFAAESEAADAYKVGINDVISINVLGHENLNVMTTVAVDGTVSFPLIGSVYVKDKSVDEIKEDVTQRLSDGFVKFPVVSVAVVKTLSKRIFVHGEVASIGAIPFEKDLNITKALSIAGGVREGGLYGTLIVKRKIPGGSGYENIVEAKLNNGFIKNKKIEETLLEPDDILVVERNETFLIKGDVTQRGKFVYDKDMTVLRALLEAGGVAERGLYGTLKLRRKQKGSVGNYKVYAQSKLNDGVLEDNKTEDVLLQPDDILVVEHSETFLIEGDVAKRGKFVLERGMTVLRAILEAGGIAEKGMFGSIKIRRKDAGSNGGYRDFAISKLNNGIIEDARFENTLLHPDDIISVKSSDTFLIKGEVAKRGRFVLENDMTVLRALLEAGGVVADGLHGVIKIRRKQSGHKDGYQDYVRSKINNGAVEDSAVEETLLVPDDILVVERNKTYFVYGEVNKTGEFVLESDTTVFKAVTIAGGFTKWGSESNVKVLRHDGTEGFKTINVNVKKVLQGDASADLLLQPGDTVIATRGIF